VFSEIHDVFAAFASCPTVDAAQGSEDVRVVADKLLAREGFALLVLFRVLRCDDLVVSVNDEVALVGSGDGVVFESYVHDDVWLVVIW